MNNLIRRFEQARTNFFAKPFSGIQTSYARIVIMIGGVMIAYFAVVFVLIEDYTRRMAEHHRNELKTIVSLGMNAVRSARAQEMRGVLTTSEAQEVALSQIQNMTYTDEQGNNALFAVRFDGTILVQPFTYNQASVGSWELRNVDNAAILRGIIDSARFGSGFYEYRHTKPQSSTFAQKVAYAIPIPEWNMIIGTSIFFDDYASESDQFVGSALIVAGVLFVLLSVGLLTAITPTVRAIRTLYGLYDQLQKDPNAVPFIAAGEYAKNSPGYRLLNGFQEVITLLQRKRTDTPDSGWMQREIQQQAFHMLELRVRERTRELEKRRMIAESLHAMLGILNTNPPLDSILAQLAAQAARLLEGDAASLLVLDEADELLTVQAVYKLPQEYVGRLSIPVGQGATGRAVTERRPVYIENWGGTLQNYQLPFASHEMRLHELVQMFQTVAAVPIIVKNRVFGAIAIFHLKQHTYNAEQLDLMATFGAQASLSIETVQLRAQAEQSAAEAERQRLARELHDAVTQTLFSASLIAEVLPRLMERNPEEGKRRLEELRQLARGALAEMRTLLLELRPQALLNAKFSELLRQLGEAVSARSRLPVQVTCKLADDQTFPPDVQVALYRIAQEALNNVVKHANANTVSLTLEDTTDVVTLCVRDNGRGFDPTTIPSDHFGVRIMRERAESVGAAFALESSPGNTMLCVTWQKRKEPAC